jgi:hypothetical protein
MIPNRPSRSPLCSGSQPDSEILGRDLPRAIAAFHYVSIAEHLRVSGWKLHECSSVRLGQRLCLAGIRTCSPEAKIPRYSGPLKTSMPIRRPAWRPVTRPERVSLSKRPVRTVGLTPMKGNGPGTRAKFVGTARSSRGAGVIAQRRHPRVDSECELQEIREHRRRSGALPRRPRHAGAGGLKWPF